VLRVDGKRGIAVSLDGPPLGERDPFLAGWAAVMDAALNVACAGGEPLALTDCLNFGNPEKPEIGWELAQAIEGISLAAESLGIPVVSGNVSLYNETNGRGILPTPTIGGVGVLDDLSKSAALAFKNEGDEILLVGETKGWLGQSAFLATVLGREEGAPPPVDLAIEKCNGDFVRSLIAGGTVTAVHDHSDGGQLVALAEMAMASNIGAKLDASSSLPAHAFWFGEDQARYVITVKPADLAKVEAAAAKAGVPLQRLGTTGGWQLTLPGADPILVADLHSLHESWLPTYMAG
jgi:phosphoribosylformylglycinamidine synthase